MFPCAGDYSLIRALILEIGKIDAAPARLRALRLGTGAATAQAGRSDGTT